MNLKITAISLAVAAFAACASSVQAQKLQPQKGELPEWAQPEQMTYAAISRTNPFEIMPSASLELMKQVQTIVAEEDATIAERLDADEASQMASDLLGYARGFLGTRYVRGGKGPKGFDCSGFTSYIFRQFGYSLSASSGSQFQQGEHVERCDIAPGDLLFFKGRASKSSRIGHVAIAISRDDTTGDITFIHASNSGGIRIDRVSAPYYAKRFVGAKRVIE